MTASETVTILIPVFNNQSTLNRLVAGIHTHLHKNVQSYDVLFVEDESRDNSRELLLRLEASNPRLNVVLNETNIGQQRSIRKGLQSCRSDIVIVMDADLQDDPRSLPVLLHRLNEEGCDVMFAARTGRYQSHGRNITGKVFRIVLRRLTNLPKGAAGFVAMRRVAYENLNRAQGKYFYLVGLLGRRKHKIGTVTIEREFRTDGQSAYSGLMRVRTAFINLICIIEDRIKHGNQ